MTDYLKKTNILIGMGMIIIIIILAVFSNKVNQPINQEKIKVSQENIKQEAILIIDDGKGMPETFEVEFKEGMTAFDLLKEKAEELDLTLKTKNYDMGIFVEAIGDKENGQDGKYWVYYVNGEMPMVASDKQELKPKDKVEFKFEKSPF